MNSLEPKPPDPWPCASSFLSRIRPCPSVLFFSPKLPGFDDLCPCSDSPLRAFDLRFDSSTLGGWTILWLHGCDHYFRKLAARFGEVVIRCDYCWLLWSGLPLTTTTVDLRLLNQGSFTFSSNLLCFSFVSPFPLVFVRFLVRFTLTYCCSRPIYVLCLLATHTRIGMWLPSCWIFSDSRTFANLGCYLCPFLRIVYLLVLLPHRGYSLSCMANVLWHLSVNLFDSSLSCLVQCWLVEHFWVRRTRFRGDEVYPYASPDLLDAQPPTPDLLDELRPVVSVKLWFVSSAADILFWWVYVMDLVQPVDGLCALVYHWGYSLSCVATLLWHLSVNLFISKLSCLAHCWLVEHFWVRRPMFSGAEVFQYDFPDLLDAQPPTPNLLTELRPVDSAMLWFLPSAADLVFWWVYVLKLVQPVDGLCALVCLSMSLSCQNNVPSLCYTIARNWCLLYDCFFRFAGSTVCFCLVLFGWWLYTVSSLMALALLFCMRQVYEIQWLCISRSYLLFCSSLYVSFRCYCGLVPGFIDMQAATSVWRGSSCHWVFVCASSVFILWWLCVLPHCLLGFSLRWWICAAILAYFLWLCFSDWAIPSCGWLSSVFFWLVVAFFTGHRLYYEKIWPLLPPFLLLPGSDLGKDDWDSSCLISFLRYWSGWIGFWFRTMDGSVPGCTTRPSVTPLVGEQPWTSAPRCCYPRSKWSMMRSIFSETFYRTCQGFRHCFCIWTYGPLSTKEWAFLQVQVFQITVIIVMLSFWRFVQPNVLWHLPLYCVLFIQHTASEDIRFLKPYTASKATFQTAFGPRTFFSCLHLPYELKVHNQFHNPSRKFPRPSLFWYKNHPFWGQYDLCMSPARVVFFMDSNKTNYPAEGVPKS